MAAHVFSGRRIGEWRRCKPLSGFRRILFYRAMESSRCLINLKPHHIPSIIQPSTKKASGSFSTCSFWRRVKKESVSTAAEGSSHDEAVSRANEDEARRHRTRVPSQSLSGPSGRRNSRQQGSRRSFRLFFFLCKVAGDSTRAQRPRRLIPASDADTASVLYTEF